MTFDTLDALTQIPGIQITTNELELGYRSDETLLLRYLGASPTLRAVDFFLDNPLSDYSKNQIVRKLGMSRVTFFKFWKELERSGAVKPTRKIGRATMYQLDRGNDTVKQLIRLDLTLARKSMERAVEDYKRHTAVLSR